MNILSKKNLLGFMVLGLGGQLMGRELPQRVEPAYNTAQILTLASMSAVKATQTEPVRGIADGAALDELLTRASGDRQHKVLIWDFGSTLVDIDKVTIARQLGIGRCMAYVMFNGSSQDLHNKLFDVLETAGGKQKGYQHTLLRDMYGRPLPQLMVDWFLGLETNRDYKQKIVASMRALKHDYFVHKRERRIIGRTIHMMFQAHKFSKILRPIKKMMRLVERAAECGYRNVLLTNIDGEAFTHFTQTEVGKRFLSNFAPQDVFISATLNMVKPHRSIYEYVLNKLHIPAEHCILIDDQPENVKGARALGMKGITIKSPSARKLLVRLKLLGVHL